jgi:hypothetical protein
VISQMVALRRGGNASSVPTHEDRLSGREFVTDAVIRQCEADVAP